MVTWRRNARLRSFKIFLEEQLTRVFSLMLSAPLGFLQATLRDKLIPVIVTLVHKVFWQDLVVCYS